MSMPNVGVTQVIQQPGIGNVLARNISGLAQALMARQEAERQRMYAEAQMQSIKAAQDERERLFKEREATGNALMQLLTPQQVSLDIPMAAPNVVGGAPANGLRPMVDVMEDASGQIQTRGPITPAGAPLQVRGTRERELTDVLPSVPAGAIPEFLRQAEPILQSRKEIAAMQRKKQALDSVISTLPEDIRPAMTAVVSANLAGLPSDLQGDIFNTLIARIPDQQVESLRKQYPLFAQLPKEQLLDNVRDITSLETQRRLQLGPEWDRIQGRQIQQARLALDRAKASMESGSNAKQRQAALDIMREVNGVLNNSFFDVMKLGADATVQKVMGEDYFKAWKRAQQYLIDRGLEIPVSTDVGPRAQGGGSGKKGAPGILNF